MNTGSLPTSAAGALVPVLAVVGTGLIGGSFAAALRASGAVGRVLGVGRQQASLSLAQSLGLIDQAVTLQQAAEQADLVFLAIPVGATEQVLTQLQPHIRPGAIITDAGSTKVNVVDVAKSVLGDKLAQFIPGHPIAGSEAAGPQSADPNLYRGRTVVLTPLAENSAADKTYLTRVWERCGAKVLTMDADVHDTVLASVSHVPHLLSSVYMWQVATAHDSDLRMALAGSGFRDFTRIAAGSAEVWRDIFTSNRAAVLSELQQVKAALEQAEHALQSGDSQQLQDFLERAALARRFWGSRSGL